MACSPPFSMPEIKRLKSNNILTLSEFDLEIILNKESGKNSFLFVINHNFGSKRFLQNEWIKNFGDSF